MTDIYMVVQLDNQVWTNTKGLRECYMLLNNLLNHKLILFYWLLHPHS